MLSILVTFIISLLFRYFINEYIDISNIFVYLDIIIYKINYILISVIESYINYDTCDGNLNDLKNSNSRIKKIDLNKHLVSFASRDDRTPSNDNRYTQRNYTPIAPAPQRGSSSQTSSVERSPILQAVHRGSSSQTSSVERSPILRTLYRDPTSQAVSSQRSTQAELSLQRNNAPIAPHYYGEDVPISMRKPWIGNHSCGYNHYYFGIHRISLRVGTRLADTNFSTEVKEILHDEMLYDEWFTPTYVEQPIDTGCINGLMSLGIKHYGNPTKPSVFYLKYFDLENGEYVFDIWKDNQNYGWSFKDFWKKDRNHPKYGQPGPLRSDLKRWKEIDEITKIDTCKAINDYMEDRDSPFNNIR
uniref:hypothetical protein n=1 Tax=Purpureocillium takamizusanense TaxID=2060973 RepID=UPI001FA6E65E|nr:hypothetical protein MRV25_mgp01 [Purpureocillium takamizusanense]UNI92592.1 hypothetical protein [Purpureocillium takamizusanense]